MLARARANDDRLPEGTYVELVRSVFATLTPTTIMGILFVTTGSFVTLRTDDRTLLLLAILGSVLSATRVILLLAHDKIALAAEFDASTAMTAERRFAVTYLSFAFVLGMFGARSLTVARPEFHMVVVALLVGYAAGVASGVSLRPWIAIPSVVISITPSIVAALFSRDSAHMMLGFVLFMFMAGGLGSVVARYRSESDKITMRRMFGSLARQDHLTKLANRLGFAERFREATSQATDCLVAIHCLDLDRFKTINDRFGHPAGDELLRAVGGRLQRVLRQGDIAARLGGDEFAIMQTHMRHSEEADMMARRILRAIGEPYSISGVPMSVGVSIGYTVSLECTDQLEDLMSQADQALYRAKSLGGGVAPYQFEGPPGPLCISA